MRPARGRRSTTEDRTSPDLRRSQPVVGRAGLERPREAGRDRERLGETERGWETERLVSVPSERRRADPGEPGSPGWKADGPAAGGGRPAGARSAGQRRAARGAARGARLEASAARD